MESYQREFIEFALERGVLRFGEFQLKSGRASPYFFNAGLFRTGSALARLGHWYAAAVLASGIEFDMLYGPAYKGIPLVATTAIALAEQHGRDVPWCFNRKEVKDHGEGGQTVGAPLAGRVLIVDDVITAGTAIRESMGLLEHHQAQASGVIISVDRQERGRGNLSAIQEVEALYGLRVASIVGLDDVMSYLEQRPEYQGPLRAIRQYQNEYGVLTG